MTRRVQVLFTEGEFEALRAAARAHGVSVGEWIRESVRRSQRESFTPRMEAKFQALHAALQVNAPTCDIEQMNREIEQGYLSGLP